MIMREMTTKEKLAEYELFADDIADMVRMKLTVFKFMFRQGSNWKTFVQSDEKSVVAGILALAKSVEEAEKVLSIPKEDESLLKFYEAHDLMDIAVIKQVFNRI